MIEVATARPFFGVEPVLNACGIYTDLGGSCLSPAVWEAASAANAAFAPIPDLLDRSGETIAEMIGVPAARVVPGASAGIALAVAACMARSDGKLMQSLPEVHGGRCEVVLQRAHRYKYARCATPAGGQIVEAGGEQGTTQEQLIDAIGERTAAVLLPAHLDGHAGSLPLAEVARIAHARQVPVIVDAAYMSYPTSLLGSYAAAGADLTCFSAKYFWGPNAGGFICGGQELVDAVRMIDFTGYESGRYLTFGRIFKLDRATIVATVLALQEWLALDHEARWVDYSERARALVERLEPALPGAVSTACFTLDERVVDEPVNSLVVTLSDPGAARLAEVLAEGSPPIHSLAEKDRVIFCLETVAARDDDLIAERILSAVLSDA